MGPDFDPTGAEKSYHSIPVLSVKDIQPQSGFFTTTDSLIIASRNEFLKAIVSAIQDPGWLLIPYYNEISRLESRGPSSQNLTPSQVDVLKTYQRENTDDLFELASAINEGHKIPHMSSTAMGDIVARALEKMGDTYPNLTMFRGCEFDISDNRFKGYDFAPGDLQTAFQCVDKDINGKVRKYPVIVMMPFYEVGRLFSMKKLWISTEGEWWRGSLQIHFLDKGERERAVKVRRLPQNKSDFDRILNEFQKRVIKV